VLLCTYMYRINELLKFDRRLYHSNDLAVLWAISNKNTLYTTIKRYVKKGVLVPIYKGLYSTIALSQLNPLELGVAITHKYTYLSTESVLSQAGIIFQNTYAYTFMSNESKKISIGKISFIFRKLTDKYLNNPSGISYQNGIYVASAERAAADMLYLNPHYHFDAPDNIDWEKLNKIQKEVGY
jgi:hypothetical protein